MPSIITDEMVKQNCPMSRPVPLKAYGMLNPNAKVGTKPSYMKKRGRTGIRYNELPIYAPATVRGLAESMCNISKVNCSEVEQYLEERIENEIQLFEGNGGGDGGGGSGGDGGELDMVLVEPEGVVFDQYDVPDVPPDIVELEDVGTQTRGRGRPSGSDREMTVDPSRFESAGEGEVEDPAGMQSVGTEMRGRGRPSRDEELAPSNLRRRREDDGL